MRESKKISPPAPAATVTFPGDVAGNAEEAGCPLPVAHRVKYSVHQQRATSNEQRAITIHLSKSSRYTPRHHLLPPLNLTQPTPKSSKIADSPQPPARPPVRRLPPPPPLTSP